ncbi:MAG: HEPN domain-containing protein [Desulfurococcales archaeon]|nr:HEPN domain-containing protein [Desulfurococcales archaeon]
MSDVTCMWMRKALDDLRLAEAALEIGVDPGLAAFHAQQAVEKALKALLTAYKVKPPRSMTYGSW